jgi:hypothetical protein
MLRARGFQARHVYIWEDSEAEWGRRCKREKP